MARKVFRYGPLEIAKEEAQLVHIPVNAKIVHVGSKSDGFIDIWAIADEDAVDTTAPKYFQIFGTGEPLPEDAQYLDTIVQATLTSFRNGSRVWHVFERLAD